MVHVDKRGLDQILSCGWRQIKAHDTVSEQLTAGVQMFSCGGVFLLDGPLPLLTQLKTASAVDETIFLIYEIVFHGASFVSILSNFPF